MALRGQHELDDHDARGDTASAQHQKVARTAGGAGARLAANQARRLFPQSHLDHSTRDT